MGRPSMATERIDAILSAAEDVATEHGLAGLTLQKVAILAGVQSSIIDHYIGNRDALVQAMADRLVQRIRDAHALVNESGPAATVLRRHLDLLFSDTFSDRRINQLLDELVVLSYVDEPTRDEVRGLYGWFFDSIEQRLARAYPAAPKQRVHDTTHAVLALAHATPVFEWLGFADNPSARSRRVVRRLLADLEIVR
jgi:AcrR family transcriptional regulator